METFRPFVTMKRLLAILAALTLCGCSTNYAGRTYLSWWLSTRQCPHIFERASTPWPNAQGQLRRRESHNNE